MVPLVFKTSLGAVRFPEGSTPSLLRQFSTAALQVEIDEDRAVHQQVNLMCKGARQRSRAVLRGACGDGEPQRLVGRSFGQSRHR